MEIWKDVKGYEGLYEVSSLGRIRRKNGKILKLDRQRNGYIHVQLYRDKERKSVCVHRLVAFAFFGEDSDKKYVNHINCNPSDNRVENLEWCTQSENIKYCYELGREKNVARKRIICVDKNKTFYSSMEAAVWVNSEQFDNSHNVNTISRTIRSCANGDDGREQSYGHKWKFADDEGSTTIP